MNYSMPLTVDIDVTNRCNFCCTHCNKSPNTITDELTRSQLIRLVDELYDLGIAEVSLGGGEPLCRKDWFDIVAQACSRPGWSVVLNTNGTLWKRADIEKIRTLPFPPRIAISLDGYTPQTYSELRQYANGKPGVSAFPQVIRTIQKMKEARLSVCLNFVVTDRTAHWAFDTIKLAQDLGADSFLLLKLMSYGRSFGHDGPDLSYQTWKEVLHKITRKKCMEGGFYQRVIASVACPWELVLPLYEIGIDPDGIFKLWGYQSPLIMPHFQAIRDVGCPAGVLYCCISADGIVMPCGVIPPKYVQVQCGSILEDTFEKIWTKSPVVNLLRNMKLEDLKDSTCETCTWRDTCGGGCRARGLFASGSIKGPDIECPLNSWRNDYE